MQITPNPTTISAFYLRQHFAQVIQQVVRDKKHFHVEKNGLPVMAIIPIDEYVNLMEVAKTVKK